MVALLAPSTSWCVQFEGPEEVVYLLEDATDGVELVDHVLNALDVVSVTQFALDNEVIGDRNATTGMLKFEELDLFSKQTSSTAYLDESSLVQQAADGLQRRISVGNVRLSDTEHVKRCLVEFHESGVVDLTQTEKLQDLLHFRSHFVDTERRKRRY